MLITTASRRLTRLDVLFCLPPSPQCNHFPHRIFFIEKVA